MTPAHTGENLAELVCSNSFRSDDDEQNAVGLLHWEMRAAGGLIMGTGDKHSLPAGGALAVDLLRELKALEALPDAPNVIYMVGHKFGTTGQEALTWAISIVISVAVVGSSSPGFWNTSSTSESAGNRIT